MSDHCRQNAFSNLLTDTFSQPAHNNDIVLNFSVILICVEQPKSNKDYVRIGSNLMGFELGYRGERKGQKSSQDSHKALNKLCTHQILGGKSFLFLHIYC